MHECTNSTPSVPSGMLISPCTLTPTHRSDVARFCGDADYLELLGRIGPSSVERLLACGALKLQRHFINQPKNDLLHAAAMQEGSDLVQAINRYGSQQKNASSLWYSLSQLRVTDTGETALTMATFSSREIHTYYILAMVADCMRSDNVFFVQRCKDGVVFRSDLTSLLLEVYDSPRQVKGHVHSGHRHNTMNTLGLAESLLDTVAIEETNLQKKKNVVSILRVSSRRSDVA